MTETWLPSFITATPQEGYDLAVKLARMAIKLTQPNDDIRSQLREEYDKNTTRLIAASQVVATHFHTVAAANEYRRGQGS